MNDRPLRPPPPADPNRSANQQGRSVDTRFPQHPQRPHANQPPARMSGAMGTQPVRREGYPQQPHYQAQRSTSPQGQPPRPPGQQQSMAGYGQPPRPPAHYRSPGSPPRSQGQVPSAESHVQQPATQPPTQSHTPSNQPPAPTGFIHSEYAARFGHQTGQTARSRGGSFLNRLPLITPLLSIPRRIWLSMLFFALVIGSVTVSINMINRDNIAGYVDTSLPAADQTRQRDLHDIKQGLLEYYAQNNRQFPIMTVRIGESADPLAAELMPLYMDNLPRDPDFPEKTYHYSSLTGKSFRLSAMLEDGTIYALDEK